MRCASLCIGQTIAVNWGSDRLFHLVAGWRRKRTKTLPPMGRLP
jgi:hypothetical protein